MVPSRMSLKEVKRTAAVAWSPPSHSSPLLATGTLAGALDASFSTLAELEIHELHLDDRNSAEVTQKTTISAPSRFNRLAWSAHNSNSVDGVIAGGCEDGSISFWSASDLLKAPNNESALLSRCEGHHGPVRGLQVNPFQPFLVASGATDAEIWLWDLNNLSQPYSPSATKSSKLEDITDLAWNRIVPHILATASSSGYTVVWDLKGRKEVLQLAAPGQRLPTSAIAWNPENATQILTATDDDQSPVIYSWDLRNARAPEKTLTGHTKGILSMAWCPKDAELLLSCGKDQRSICWNPKTGSVVAELTHSDNWLFDVQWCPRNPDLFSTASFSGQVEVNSFQSLVSGGSRPIPQSANPEDFFAMAGASQAQRVAPAAHLQIPKWLRRPIGVSFGFGGRLVTFSSLKSERPCMVSVISVAGGVGAKFATDSSKLDVALSHQTLGEYCVDKIPSAVPNLHVSDSEAVFWNVAKVMFESDPQQKLMNLLGFDTQQLEDKIRSLSIAEESSAHRTRQETIPAVGGSSSSSKTSPVAAEPHKFDDFFGGGQDDADAQFDFGSLVQGEATAAVTSSSAPQTEEETMTTASETALADAGHVRRGTFEGVPFPLFAQESSEIDRTITRAIILGNFEAAVDLCVKADRLSDALLVAICGGDELVAKTQQLYFQKARFPYLRVVSGIVKKDISDVVQHAFIENWEEILALICSYGKGAKFAELCNILGSRIEAVVPTNPKMATPALICFMAAGNAIKAIQLVLSEQERLAPSRQSPEYTAWLEHLIEKTRIIEQISGYVAPQNVVPIQENIPEINDRFIEYSWLMADQGLLDIAVRYFNSFSEGRVLEALPEDLVAVFGDRLAKAARTLNIPMRAVPEPFASQAIDVRPESAAPSRASATLPMSHAQPSSGMGGAPQMGAFAQASSPHHHHPAGPTLHGGIPPPHPHSHHQPQAPPQPSWSAGGSAPGTGTGMGGGPAAGGAFPPVPTMPSHHPGGMTTAARPSPMPPSFPTPPAPMASSSSPFARPPMMMPAGVPPPTSAPTVPPPLPSAPSTSAPHQHHHQFATAPVPGTHSYGPPSPTQVPPPPLPMMGAAPPSLTAPMSTSPPPPMQSMPGSSSFTPHAPYATAPAPSSSMMPSGAPIISTSPAPPRPSLVPQPPRPTASPLGGEPPSRRSTGAYNDPPMVAPRIPAAPPAAERPIAPLSPPPMMPGTAAPGFAGSTGGAPTTSAATMAAAPPPAKTQQGPVDPSKIPADMQSIYRTFSTLIVQCQERALPMQRRVVEDSAKRMQALFHQLVNHELSPPVTQLVGEMCSNISSGQFDRAHDLHTPLMTNYFAEAGAWVLAAKRLIEVAKVCLQ